MYKKLLTVMLACMTAAVLTACGGSSATSAASASGSVASGSEASASASAASDTASAASASAASESASAASASAESADTFDKGETSGATYTNSYFGISWDIPEGWTYADDDQLADLSGMVIDVADDEALTEAMQSGQALIDMFAQSADQLSNVNTVIEAGSAAEIAATSEEQILKNATEGALQGLQAQGYTDIQQETNPITFCGKSTQAVKLTYTISGVPVYQNMVVLKGSEYVMSIVATTAQTDTTDDLLAGFQAI